MRCSARLFPDQERSTPRVVQQGRGREGLAEAGPNDVEKKEKGERSGERREKKEEKGEEKERKRKRKEKEKEKKEKVFEFLFGFLNRNIYPSRVFEAKFHFYTN